MGAILLESTELAFGVMTPDAVTLEDGAIQGVRAELAVAKFMLFAPASHVDGEHVDQSLAGMIGIEDNERVVKGPVALTSMSTCVGLKTLTPFIDPSPPSRPTETPLALKAM